MTKYDKKNRENIVCFLDIQFDRLEKLFKFLQNSNPNYYILPIYYDYIIFVLTTTNWSIN